MPRNADGSASLPSGTIVNSGDTLLVSQHNPAMSDIASMIGNSLDRDGSGGMRAPLLMGGQLIQNVAPGVADTDAATVGQLSSGGGAIPVGCVMDYAGSSAPAGWLLCGGQSISRATYADLFAIIGTTYGALDGTTFRLPDLRGRVTAGLDFSVSGLASRLTATTMSPDGATLAATGGTQTHTLTTAQMPAHTHTLSGSTSSDGAHTHGILLGDGGGATTRLVGGPLGAAGSTDTQSGGAHTHSLTGGSAASTGGDGAHLNMQPTMLMNKIIKATS